MSNVVRLLPLSEGSKSARPSSRPPREVSARMPSLKPLDHADLAGVASTHGFEAFAVLDIAERRGGLIFPRMRFHNLPEGLAAQIDRISDLTQCSVFLMLGETNSPFPFTTGLDCRTNEKPDAALLDNQLDALLNTFGLRGGYCVPVCDPEARRSVVMYFGVRAEIHSRYPGLVIDTIETYDMVWHKAAAAGKTVRAGLSALELTCLTGLARGLTVREIAVDMALSEQTIAALARSLTGKLGAGSLHEAIHKASRMGLLGG